MRFSLHAFSRFPRLRRHCSHAELVAFQCASLDEAAARRAALHISSCSRCSSELHVIREDMENLERSLTSTPPLASIAAEDWSRLLQALRASPRQRPSPEILSTYLGSYACSAAGSDPPAVEVLGTLLGARAAAAVSSAVIDRPGPSEESA